MEENKTEEVQTNEQPITEQPTEEVVSEPVQLGSNPVQTEEVTPVVEQPVVEQPVVDPVPVQPIKRRKKDIIGYNPETGEPIYKEYAPGEIPPKKSKKGLIITIIILVLLIVGGLTTWLLLSNNGDSDTDEPKTEEKDNKKDEDKKEDNKKSVKTIYFYKGTSNVGGSSYYHVKYDYDAPSNKSDILATYECDTEECAVNAESVEFRGTSYDLVTFSGAVIEEKDYYNYFDGKNTIKLNVSGDADFVSCNEYANMILTYKDDSSNFYAIYSLKANKKISDFEYSRNTGSVLLASDKAYINIYKPLKLSDVYDITTGKQITDAKEIDLFDYLYDYFDFTMFASGISPYNFNLGYIKENGLTKEVYLDSSVMYGSMGGANQGWLSQQQPSADECSLTDESGKEYKCNELKMYDFDKVDASVYKYFGKHLDKEDCVDSNNRKYCVYVSSINAIGFIGSGNIKSSSAYDTRSALVSYKINGDKVDVKFAYMEKADIKNDACTSVVNGNAECMKYLLDNYNNKKASTYTLHLVWDTDHYYIDSIDFDK